MTALVLAVLLVIAGCTGVTGPCSVERVETVNCGEGGRSVTIERPTR